MLAHALENFGNICLEINELNPAKHLSAQQAALKNTKVKLDIMTNFDILSMVIKHIRGGIFYAIHQYEKANNKYIKNYHENKESS